jgi:hypothetical protein
MYNGTGSPIYQQTSKSAKLLRILDQIEKVKSEIKLATDLAHNFWEAGYGSASK